MRSLNFLLSFSRSGSTLLMSHLGTHQDIETDVGEPNFLYRLISDPHILYDNYERLYGMRRGEVTQNYNEGVRAMTKEYYNRLCNHTQRSVVVLKHPWLTEHAQRLAIIFPDSKIIYLIRHPYDVIASTYHFTQINKVAEKMFGKCDLDNIMSCYERAFASMSSPEVRKLNPMIIKYEDYIKEQQKHLKKMFSFVGVDYSDDVVGFVQNMYSSNRGHGVGSYISDSRIFSPRDKWEEVLNENMRQRIRQRLGALRQSLGYSGK